MHRLERYRRHLYAGARCALEPWVVGLTDVRYRTASDYRRTQAAAVKSNRLIEGLPRRSQSRILASCELVDLRFAAVLCDEGQPLQQVYFPLDSVISLVTTLPDGARLEVGIIGNEGMLGTSIFLGVSVWPQHAVVQGGGSALRMSTAAFRRLCKQDMALREVLNRYVHVLIEQLSQTAACTLYHPVERRLALVTHDPSARGRRSFQSHT